MALSAIGARLGYWPSFGTVMAGMALRDCALIAAAAPLALGAFYLRMDAMEPMDAFRAALRCVLAGGASLLASVVLVLMALAAIHGAWWPAHERFLAGGAFLLVSIGCLAIVVGVQDVEADARRFLLIALATLLVGVGAGYVAEGSEWSLCGFPVAIAVLMAGAGWRLLRDVASGFLGAGLRR